MKILRKNNLIKKIAIIILFIMCFNMFSPTTKVQAKVFENGGSFLQPIMDFLVFLADAVLNILQHNFISMRDVVVSPTGGDKDWGSALGWLGVGLLAVVVVAVGVATIATGGGILVGALLVVGGGAGTIYSSGEIIDNLTGEFDLPFIAYHPYTIFSGDVPALDINFINPGEPKSSDYDYEETETISNIIKYSNQGSTPKGEAKYIDKCRKLCEEFKQMKNNGGLREDNVLPKLQDFFLEVVQDKYSLEIMEITSYTEREERSNGVHYIVEASLKQEINNENEKSTTNALLKLDFKNYFRMTSNPDLNFGADISVDYIEKTSTSKTREYKSSASILQSSISTWYKVLRRVALVGLLSVLLYVGIQIILSAAAADKAKYKKMFVDWLVAVCMLFVLHYLMVFIVTLSSKLSEVFAEAGVYNMTVTLPEETKLNGEELINMTESELPKAEGVSDLGQNSKVYFTYNEEGKRLPTWSGEFMGYIRLLAGQHDARNQLAYGLMYIVLVIYVCTFTFMYLRRVLYMAFLTMIAPLIALTYPIDKIKDGQAQAFGMWIKEYVFNALIQPVHLIIYTMTVSQAINLAKDHPVYALVALGFILPAEKFVRSMFGFQKASSLDKPGSAFGGAALMSAVGLLSKIGKGKEDKDDNTDKPTRTADKNSPNLPDFAGGANPGLGAGTGENDASGNNLGEHNPIGNEAGENNPSTPGANNIPQNGNSQNQDVHARAANAFSQGGSKGRTVGQKLRNATASMSNRARNRLIKSKPLKFVGKLTGRVAGAAAIGMVGLAAGIASGDYKQALKYTGSGLAIGGTLGANLAERGYNVASKTKESFKEGYMGSEAYNNQKLDNEYFNGKGYQEMLNNSSLMPNLSGAERNRALREEIGNYRSYGITDNKQIEACMKAGFSSNEGAAAMTMVNSLKSMGVDAKSMESYRQQYRDQLQGQFDSSRLDAMWDFMKANL